MMYILDLNFVYDNRQSHSVHPMSGQHGGDGGVTGGPRLRDVLSTQVQHGLVPLRRLGPGLGQTVGRRTAGGPEPHQVHGALAHLQPDGYVQLHDPSAGQGSAARNQLPGVVHHLPGTGRDGPDRDLARAHLQRQRRRRAPHKNQGLLIDRFCNPVV